MNTFEDLVKYFMCNPSENQHCYSPNGKTFYADTDYYKGNYWFYESEDFIVDIHDFYIKKEYVEVYIPDMSDFMFLVSNYIVSGSGEWLSPYKSIESGSMLIMSTKHPVQRYVLHSGCRFFVVGMKFKENMIEKYSEKGNFRVEEIEKIFLDTQNDVVQSIKKIADEIINCSMSGLSADLFFEAKAKEWLSITLNTYEQRGKHNLRKEDEASLETVAAYLSDHYAYDISQTFLEKIAMMSGTKLKTSFKQKYNMSITEFTQRKRMNVAENLLLTTDMDIKDVAKAVGYNSHSRFSAIFKRYKGTFPKDIRKHMRQKNAV